MCTHQFRAGFLLSTLASIVGLSLGCSQNKSRSAPVKAAVVPAAVAIDQYAIAPGPVHENLTLFFISGPDKIKGEQFLSLQEALQQKKIVVRETGNVQELTVQNLSDQPIFIQAGEIVRGGQQDRCLPYDMLVEPKSKEMPIDSFCVEQGRWHGRAGEAAGKFEASANMLSGNEQRISASIKGDQGAVWDSVAKSQDKLSAKLGKDVKDARSSSSLELTLSGKEVQQATDAYVRALGKSLENSKDVVGIAVAINGKVQTIDIYASSAMFRKLWPKLLRASAVEAISSGEKGLQFAQAAPKDVRDFMLETRKAQATQRTTVSGMLMEVRHSGKAAAFTSKYRDEQVHDSYIKKEEQPKDQPQDQPEPQNLPNPRPARYR